MKNYKSSVLFSAKREKKLADMMLMKKSKPQGVKEGVAVVKPLKLLSVSAVALSALIAPVAHAQVGGLSASKVGTICAGPVPEKDLEFEPSFSFSRAKKQWDANNKPANSFSTSDSVEIASGFAIRCTYGFSEKFEMGISVPADVSESSLGSKYQVWSNDKSAIAAIAGINLPMGNRVYSDKSNSLDDIGSLAGGVCFSHQYIPEFLWDVDIQVQKLLNDAGSNNHSDLFVNTDIGFYPKEQVQLICGLSYFNHFYRNNAMNTFLLDIHPGISYETGENFLIVLGSSFGLLGKNVSQAWDISLAFTTTFR